jgi:hypothetical protein
MRTTLWCCICPAAIIYGLFMSIAGAQKDESLAEMLVYSAVNAQLQELLVRFAAKGDSTGVLR